MKSKFNKHNYLYNILLTLSRDLFFYKKIGLSDTFETRIYLMFFHFSIFLIIYRKKNSKFDQKEYDYLFFNIENNLRESGLGDVTVNKKMKEFNKILYDILLKLNLETENNKFTINEKLLKSYFSSLNNYQNEKLAILKDYLHKFFNFCFDKPLDNMIRETNNFKY